MPDNYIAGMLAASSTSGLLPLAILGIFISSIYMGAKVRGTYLDTHSNSIDRWLLIYH